MLLVRVVQKQLAYAQTYKSNIPMPYDPGTGESARIPQAGFSLRRRLTITGDHS